MLAFDLTAQLAPVAWGVLGLLLASGLGIVSSALHYRPSDRKGSATGRTPRSSMRHHPLPAAA